jgi:hypothetical protein
MSPCLRSHRNRSTRPTHLGESLDSSCTGLKRVVPSAIILSSSTSSVSIAFGLMPPGVRPPYVYHDLVFLSKVAIGMDVPKSALGTDLTLAAALLRSPALQHRVRR